jgi:Mrp family chromosome partitioning ATPase/predicted Fe-Mo cluster-binding NifX family protein
MDKIKHKIVVLSGKGGVGKSTVSTNLAVSLSLSGKKVGLLDVDIHGPSIPQMLGMERQRPQDDGTQLFPISFSENLKVISIDFFLPGQDEAVIWRGSMKYSLIKQFLSDVDWGELDYLIIDCPPGTGDEPLTVVQLLENPMGAIVVTTPQDVAMANVRRSLTFCNHVKLPVLGVVENMSGYVCQKCGEVTDIFKSGGAQKMAEDFAVPFLGKIPLDPMIVMSGDSGKPYVEHFAHSDTSHAFGHIAKAILEIAGALQEKNPIPSFDDLKKIVNGTIRIAIPVTEGELSAHFGHCEQFIIFDVNTEDRTIVESEPLTPPPHEPGVLPQWLSEQNTHLIIAGGMGARAQSLFSEKGITVITGVNTDKPGNLIMAFLNNSLLAGDNICDH